MDWKELTKDIVTAARTSFSELLARHGDETFYAFVLYTDEDCWTVVPAANSLEQHRAKFAGSGDADPKTLAYYKWASAEWAYEAYEADAFNAICTRLRDACGSVSDDEAFDAFKANVHNAMIDALKALDDEGFFGKGRDNAVLFITSSDDDGSKAMEDRSARLLNPPEIYEPFLRRYQG